MNVPKFTDYIQEMSQELVAKVDSLSEQIKAEIIATLEALRDMPALGGKRKRKSEVKYDNESETGWVIVEVPDNDNKTHGMTVPYTVALHAGTNLREHKLLTVYVAPGTHPQFHDPEQIDVHFSGRVIDKRSLDAQDDPDVLAAQVARIVDRHAHHDFGRVVPSKDRHRPAHTLMGLTLAHFAHGVTASDAPIGRFTSPIASTHHDAGEWTIKFDVPTPMQNTEGKIVTLRFPFFVRYRVNAAEPEVVELELFAKLAEIEQMLKSTLGPERARETFSIFKTVFNRDKQKPSYTKRRIRAGEYLRRHGTHVANDRGEMANVGVFQLISHFSSNSDAAAKLAKYLSKQAEKTKKDGMADKRFANVKLPNGLYEEAVEICQRAANVAAGTFVKRRKGAGESRTPQP